MNCNCQDVSDLSPLYLSRRLDADRVAAVRRHLESCAACAAQMETDARVRDTLLAEPVDTSALDRRVRENLAAPSRRRWISLAASIAAAVVIAVAAYQVSSTPDRTCAAAASDHRREVVEQEPRRWLQDASAIGALAEQQRISASAVARLTPDGFQLERAKLCRLNGRTFLHLVYSAGSGQVSVFLRQNDGAAAAIRSAESARQHVAYFDTAQVSAIVISAQSTESATKLARFAQGIL